MNYRTILLATATVMFAGAANAEDITAPMYLPGTGKVLSNTSVQYDRTKLKHNGGAAEDFRAAEEITYGVTDDFAVVAELGNQFDFKGLTNQEYNNDTTSIIKSAPNTICKTAIGWLRSAAHIIPSIPKAGTAIAIRIPDGTKKLKPTSN